jgi:hypothetical protein
VDPLLGAFFDALDQIDPRWRANTMFVISCDHGRTETSGTPADQLALTQAKDVLLRAGFDPDSIEFANDIGLAHVYLRPAGADWSESPDASALRAAAEALAADPALAGEVEFVCYRNGNYSCVPLLDQDRLRLLERLNSGRTGDVLLLARPARYFGNGQAIGSHHGALDDTDLAVPLILAGGGIRPGRVTEPVGTVQIVASIASYLGIPVENTEPVLPGLNFGRAKAQTLVTGHTKVPE